MANRTFNQFFYTFHRNPVLLDCNIAIGSTGTVGTIKGPGIKAVTRLAVGTYRIQFQDNYFRYFGGFSGFVSPLSGSNVASGSLTPGTIYVITSVGTTNWQTAGLPAGITAAVGQAFLAAATSTGTGQAQTVLTSGITSIEVLGDTNQQLGPQGSVNQGGYIVIQCLGPTSSGSTVPIPTDPASGSVLGLTFYLSNSSVTVQGE